MYEPYNHTGRPFLASAGTPETANAPVTYPAVAPWLMLLCLQVHDEPQLLQLGTFLEQAGLQAVQPATCSSVQALQVLLGHALQPRPPGATPPALPGAPPPVLPAPAAQPAATPAGGSSAAGLAAPSAASGRPLLRAAEEPQLEASPRCGPVMVLLGSLLGGYRWLYFY